MPFNVAVPLELGRHACRRLIRAMQEVLIDATRDSFVALRGHRKPAGSKGCASLFEVWVEPAHPSSFADAEEGSNQGRVRLWRQQNSGG